MFAQADDAHVLLRVGDTLPSGETVLSLADPQVMDDGHWSAYVTLSGAPTLGVTRDGLVVDGQLVLAEGHLLPTGEVIEVASQHDLAPDGILVAALTIRAPGGAVNEQVVWRNGAIVIREGPVTGAGVPAGAVLSRISDVDFNGVHAVLNGKLRVALVEMYCTLAYDFTNGTTSPTVSLIGLEGQILPPFNDPYYVPYTGRAIHIDSVGAVAFYGRVLSASGPLDCAWVDGLGAFLDGGPTPLPNSVWEPALSAELVHGEGGNHAVAARVQFVASGAIASGIFRNGQQVALVGSPLNGASGLIVQPYDVTSISMADDGELFFIVPLGSSTVLTFAALMADGEMLIRMGQSTASGATITGVPSPNGGTLDASPDGNLCVFRATLSGGTEALCVHERNVGRSPGCASAPNSTGVHGRLVGHGFSYVAANDLVISAVDLPLNAFGYLNTSRSGGFVVHPGGSVGNLCLGGSIGRFVAQVQSSGASGVIATTIDLTNMPHPTGSQVVAAGQNWAFQLWHRDAGPNGPVSNWTDPLTVLFH